jgi:phage-related protein
MLTFKTRTIKFFRNSAGKYPIEKFLDSLPAKQAQKVTWVMQLVEELKKVPEIYLKKLKNTDNIWEIRTQAGSNIFRILGFFEANNFIATNGFCKKNQKTPANEIVLAEKRRHEYYKRGKQK